SCPTRRSSTPGRIARFAAKRRDHEGHPAKQHRDGSVSDPGGNGASEEGARLFGTCVGRKIEILRLFPEQEVAHTSPHEPRFSIVFRENFDELVNGAREALWLDGGMHFS